MLSKLNGFQRHQVESSVHCVRFCLSRSRFLQRLLCLVLLFVCSTVVTSAQARIVRNDDSAEQAGMGVPLYEWRDTTVAVPQAICVTVHGAAQQAGALDALAFRLATLGYLVMAPDLRGNGRWRNWASTANTSTSSSSGAYADLMTSCSDLSVLLSMLRREYPDRPLFCIGESAGAIVVLNALAHDSAQVRGIVLCSAGYEPRLHNPANLGPGFLSKLLNIDKPVDMSHFLTRYVSDDARVSNEMIHDPLSRKSLSALDLIGTLNFINQAPQIARQVPGSVAVLMLQGQEDQIVNPTSADRVFAALTSSDKRFMLLPGCGHILIGTSFLKDAVYGSIARWLEEHGGLPMHESN
jgi:alpha-beta hydrolase superfamily lysophospholipase